MKYVLILLMTLCVSFTQAGNCPLGKLEDITRCATQGDRIAQTILGYIYFQGKEVPRNYKTSFDWMTKAANQGDKDAQYSLGSYYYNGWGTKRDLVLAYLWWSLSIINNEDPIVRNSLDTLEEKLSPAELARAQKMASEWLASHQSSRQREVEKTQPIN